MHFMILCIFQRFILPGTTLRYPFSRRNMQYNNWFWTSPLLYAYYLPIPGPIISTTDDSITNSLRTINLTSQLKIFKNSFRRVNQQVKIPQISQIFVSMPPALYIPGTALVLYRGSFPREVSFTDSLDKSYFLKSYATPLLEYNIYSNLFHYLSSGIASTNLAGTWV